MSCYLLAVSLGPVQDFIAQARRTRDLWFGSELLSSLSSEVAKSLREQDATLIFPAVESLSPTGRRGPGVANKILAIVTSDPRPLVEEAREATRRRLHACWEQVARKREVDALLHPSAHAAAQEQLDTFLELFAAWAPWAQGTQYGEVRERVERGLAARKSLHAFSSWRHQGNGLHKSSLDGARESVLQPPEKRPPGAAVAFRIGPREELDAIGLIKRASPQPRHFVPVPSIGLADWVQYAFEHHGDLVKELKQYCDQRAPHFTRIRSEAPWVQALPYDAQVLLPDRWRPYFEEILEGSQLNPQEEALRFGQQYVRPLLQAVGSEPFPFVACLVADGDRMGAALTTLADDPRGHERQQALSRALSTFSPAALAIVEEQYRGVLVYAGGDDVLAFLCLPDALACAKALREAFQEEVGSALQGMTPPTLSVGLGVGHVMEAMGDLLELGRRAEQLAKGSESERDGLAVLVAKRGGQERSWRCPWGLAPQQKIDEAMRCLESARVTLGKVHELESLLVRLPVPEAARPEQDWAGLLTCEAERILLRTGAGADARGPRPDEVGLTLRGDYATLRKELQAWVDRLLVAEELSRAQRHRSRKGGKP